MKRKLSQTPRNKRRRAAYVHTGRPRGRPLKYAIPGVRRSGHHLVRIQKFTKGAVRNKFVY
jgi:hypothetical protein